MHRIRAYCVILGVITFFMLYRLEKKGIKFSVQQKLAIWFIVLVVSALTPILPLSGGNTVELEFDFLWDAINNLIGRYKMLSIVVGTILVGAVVYFRFKRNCKRAADAGVGSMVVEVDDKKYDYLTNKVGWEKAIRELPKRSHVNIIAYDSNPEFFFQVLHEGNEFLIQKRAKKYALEYALPDMDSSQIIELIGLYFTSESSFNSYFKWVRTEHGLSAAEEMEYKKYTWKTHRYLLFKSLGIIAVSAFPVFYFNIAYLKSWWRFLSVPGLIGGAIGLFKCFKWEMLHAKRLRFIPISEYKLLIAALTCGFFCLVIIFSPFIRLLGKQ